MSQERVFAVPSTPARTPEKSLPKKKRRYEPPVEALDVKRVSVGPTTTLQHPATTKGACERAGDENTKNPRYSEQELRAIRGVVEEYPTLDGNDPTSRAYWREARDLVENLNKRQPQALQLKWRRMSGQKRPRSEDGPREMALKVSTLLLRLATETPNADPSRIRALEKQVDRTLLMTGDEASKYVEEFTWKIVSALEKKHKK